MNVIAQDKKSFTLEDLMPGGNNYFNLQPKNLHGLAPVEYIKAYRLQAACQMLAKGQEAVTVISHECGLGSSSYFGKVFREYTHCSPTEYRRKWQNSDR